MLARLNTRFFHASRRALTAELEESLPTITTANKLGLGKKKQPSKQQLVILDARQSKLVQKSRKQRHTRPQKQQDKIVDSSAIEEVSKLLNYTPLVKLSSQDLIHSIASVIPENDTISPLRSKQISQDLSKSYTKNQLLDYIKLQYPKHSSSLTKYTKKGLINKIITQCWSKTISTEVDPQNDLLIRRTFTFTPKQFFILTSQRKETIDTWIRKDVKIIISPKDLKMVVRAKESHIQYIELRLDQLFKDIVTSQIDLGKVYELFEKVDEELPLNEIQEISSSFFEPNTLEDGTRSMTDYTVSSTRMDNIRNSKRLILWSLDYNPFTKINLHIDPDSKQLKFFKIFPDESFPWIHREKTFLRLRAPHTRLALPISKPQLNIDQLYTELTQEPESKSLLSSISSSNQEVQTLTAVSFGQLLYDDSTHSKKTIMNTNISLGHERIMKLPLYNPEGDEDFVDKTVDQHSYHVLIKFVPSPFNKNDNYLKYPPVEFWLNINEFDECQLDTLSAVAICNEQSSICSLPHASTDVKFLKSDSIDLVEPFDNTETWLQNQQGIARFLRSSNLKFDSLHIPEFVDINIPSADSPIRYDYVNLYKRREIALTFQNRLLNYTVSEGGTLGGRTTEIVLVGGQGNMDKQEFKEFVDDALEFVQQIDSSVD